jgi:hypothetical protein
MQDENELSPFFLSGKKERNTLALSGMPTTSDGLSTYWKGQAKEPEITDPPVFQRSCKDNGLKIQRQTRLFRGILPTTSQIFPDGIKQDLYHLSVRGSSELDEINALCGE